MFYKPLYSQLLLISFFFTFIIGVFPLAAGDTNDKDIDPLLAMVYKLGNISKLWVSEKLGGVRRIWNDEKLHFRRSKLIISPDWFTGFS